MTIDRRSFLHRSAGVLGAATLTSLGGAETLCAQNATRSDRAPGPIRTLRPLAGPVAPISDEERLARIEKARRLMAANGMSAMFLEPGSSMLYYTGARWGLSERPFGVVIPVRGDLAYISPAFEEQRAREQTKFSNDVRVWQEDESPYQLVADILRDRGIATGKLGIEERVRFFIVDGIHAAATQAELVLATPVTAGCRMIKSAAEIALMQRANDITLAAQKAAFATMREGMTQSELSRNMAEATRRLGGESDGALVLFGTSSAYPHGSVHPQTLKEGDVVLVDAGCTVEGYTSDITRTSVFGKPTQRQRDVWEVEKHAQTAALAAAQVGATCESVDAAARQVITQAGFGPDYRLPGLPHRTGHGIGLDGHEWTNFVRGNKTRIEPGMCFSDEPTIAIYGEFGIRLEDCLHVTEQGPVMFTPQSPSIETPVA